LPAPPPFSRRSNGIIHLEVRIDHRLRLSLEKITQSLAESWRGEEELRSATAYVVHVYKSDRPTGLAIATHNRSSDEIAQHASQQIRMIPTESQYADVLLTILKGTFAQVAPGETQTDE
jgi:hypothetical protein